MFYDKTQAKVFIEFLNDPILAELETLRSFREALSKHMADPNSPKDPEEIICSRAFAKDVVNIDLDWMVEQGILDECCDELREVVTALLIGDPERRDLKVLAQKIPTEQLKAYTAYLHDCDDGTSVTTAECCVRIGTVLDYEWKWTSEHSGGDHPSTGDHHGQVQPISRQNQRVPGEKDIDGGHVALPSSKEKPVNIHHHDDDLFLDRILPEDFDDIDLQYTALPSGPPDVDPCYWRNRKSRGACRSSPSTEHVEGLKPAPSRVWSEGEYKCPACGRVCKVTVTGKPRYHHVPDEDFERCKDDLIDWLVDERRMSVQKARDTVEQAMSHRTSPHFFRGLTSCPVIGIQIVRMGRNS